MDKNKVWTWNANLAWELFSAGIFNYKLSLIEAKEHKKHAYYKNTIFNAVTAVEAFCNEILSKDKGWNERKLNRKSLIDKFKVFDVDYKRSKFKDSKAIRNNFLVHHKRKDYRYFYEINQLSTLAAIESSQAIIAELSYRRNTIFPYWITGLNFINPRSRNDICLMNDYEFWSRFKWLKTNNIVNSMILSSGKIIPPKEEKVYKSLYKDMWENLKRCNFRLKVLDKLRLERFPHMPFLTSEWWIDYK